MQKLQLDFEPQQKRIIEEAHEHSEETEREPFKHIDFGNDQLQGLGMLIIPKLQCPTKAHSTNPPQPQKTRENTLREEDANFGLQDQFRKDSLIRAFFDRARKRQLPRKKSGNAD